MADFEKVLKVGDLQPGEMVNIETDILAKYVEQQLHGPRPTPGQ